MSTLFRTHPMRGLFLGSRSFTLLPCDLSVTWGIGDMNCDGTSGKLSFGDINPFVLVLCNPSNYALEHPRCHIMLGDINGDGSVDIGDINPFVALLSGD